MTEPRPSGWTMARFLEEEFGPPMLLRAGEAVLEAQQRAEALVASGSTMPTRRRLRELLQRLEETARIHHWTEEEDILAELNELPLLVAEVAALLEPLRAGLRVIESRLRARLVATVTPGRRGDQTA